ncbi:MULTISPECIES: hypothetical protein [Pseudomonas]|nr:MULTISPECIES: hypothetical protein [Pseudomonas]
MTNSTVRRCLREQALYNKSDNVFLQADIDKSIRGLRAIVTPE